MTLGPLRSINCRYWMQQQTGVPRYANEIGCALDAYLSAEQASADALIAPAFSRALP